MDNVLSRTLACAFMLLAPATATRAAQTPGTITGHVVDAQGAAVASVDVRLVDLARSVRSDDDGAFRFDAVPPGEHLVEAVSERFGSAVERLTLGVGQTLDLTLSLDRAVHADAIVVSASATARTAAELVQATHVLTDEELSFRLQGSLGETLAAEPGITSTYFGPGASRPLIRGLGGDRVRILENGTDVGDASNTSPDHAVASDPASAEQIEILRGPASLLYGSAAIGGIVNVISDVIPSRLPDAPVEGRLDLRLGSNADARSGSAHLGGAIGRLAWHVEGFGRDANDLDIPNDAELGEEHEGEEHEGEEHEEDELEPGVLPNSALESSGGAVGLAWIGTRGSLGVAVRGYDTLYGIPAGHEHHDHEEEGEGEEEFVRIDLRQRRIDLRGILNPENGPFRTVKLDIGSVDYDHRELEGDETGTLFENESWEARLQAAHGALGRFTGDVGLQVAQRDFSAIGEEAFVQPNTTDRLAIFAMEEAGFGRVNVQFGARYERQETSSTDPTLPDRSLDGFSTSVGALWSFAPDWALVANLARSTKLPNAEELYANGPHLATNAFEVGDPNLSDETSLGFDLALRRSVGRVSGELSLFENRFDNFIYLAATGDELDELPVYQYVQDDTRFRGLEAEVHIELLELEPHHLELELSYDQVRATLRESGAPLPQIPPQRFGAALLYRGDHLDGRLEVRRTATQNRVAPGETTTDGYTFLNMSLGWRFFLANTLHRLELRGTNLTDEVGRVHTSFLKDEIVLPGRDVMLVYRLDF